MIRRGALMLALFGLTGQAVSAVPDTFNYSYRVFGDQPALPVQAFDDGEQLYIQLRDPAAPPAAIGANGPIPFKIKGHYLIVPLVDALTLRYGGYRADVVSDGAQGFAPGVVSVNRPVDALAATVVPRIPSVEPVHRADTIVVSANREEVTGQIEVGGVEGLIRGDDTIEGFAYRAAGQVTLSYDQGTMPNTFSRFSSRIVSIGAGGTVAGVQAAQAAVNVCSSAGAICRIDYKAGTPGVLTLDVKEPR